MNTILCFTYQHFQPNNKMIPIKVRANKSHIFSSVFSINEFSERKKQSVKRSHFFDKSQSGCCGLTLETLMTFLFRKLSQRISLKSLGVPQKSKN